MTPDTIIATIHSRGGRLRPLNGDRLAVAPRSVLDDGLRDAIRRQKPALVQLLKSTSSPTPAHTDYHTIYAAVATDTGSAEDLAACSWWYDHGHRDLPERLTALESECERLAQDGADETTYRQAVEALVALIHQVRAEYRRRSPSR